MSAPGLSRSGNGTPRSRFHGNPERQQPYLLLLRRLPKSSNKSLLVSWLLSLPGIEEVGPNPLAEFYLEDQGFDSVVVKCKTYEHAVDLLSLLMGPNRFLNCSDLIAEEYMPCNTKLGKGPDFIDSSARRNVNSPSARAVGAFSNSLSMPSSAHHASHELPSPQANSQFQTLFSSHSHIGNQLAEQGSATSSKSLIDADDETNAILNDPLSYAENNPLGYAEINSHGYAEMNPLGYAETNPTTWQGPTGSQTPTTQVPYRQMAGPPFINGQTSTPSPLPAFNDSMSPRNGAGESGHAYQMPLGQQPMSTSTNYRYPPVNPADQNPPCNTLYVGNLPNSTTEEELKALFSKQRGYKRLCFRTKANGPMCFVEFEDVSCATKALSELYGQMLSTSVKGGIRLSFSKNPLGVRSPGHYPPQAGGTPLHNGARGPVGPPPGLSAPPGLGPQQSSGQPWNTLGPRNNGVTTGQSNAFGGNNFTYQTRY